MGKASDTAGVKPMSIAGRYVRERERLLGMTDAERAFRAQWLKDQVLTHREPVNVPEMYNFQYNPIRRFYRAPLEALQRMLTPSLGFERARNIRYFTGKALIGIGLTYWFTYYLKYNQNDWTRLGGIYVNESREAVLPGDPGYPFVSKKHEGRDYADRDFSAYAQMKL
ncbi:uncharacterized protein ND-B17 [Atheta coriaria]|uniref:uncharacterized protein ND-B17 n=1 Tax=Dalotia coriaria TaxID=877792 RepID=UPI0031F3A984